MLQKLDNKVAVGSLWSFSNVPIGPTIFFDDKAGTFLSNFKGIVLVIDNICPYIICVFAAGKTGTINGGWFDHNDCEVKNCDDNA